MDVDYYILSKQDLDFDVEDLLKPKPLDLSALCFVLRKSTNYVKSMIRAGFSMPGGQTTEAEVRKWVHANPWFDLYLLHWAYGLNPREVDRAVAEELGRSEAYVKAMRSVGFTGVTGESGKLWLSAAPWFDCTKPNFGRPACDDTK